MGEFVADAFDRAVTDSIGHSYFTKPIPVSVGAQVRYLVKREKGDTARVAQSLGVSRRQVQRWVSGATKKANASNADKIRQSVTRQWQPGNRRKAQKAAASSARGVTVYTRASFGFASPAGTTDDPRMRRLTQNLPASYAQAIAQARNTGASEAQLRDIVALGFQNEYFRTGGGGRENLICELTNIDFIDMEIT